MNIKTLPMAAIREAIIRSYRDGTAGYETCLESLVRTGLETADADNLLIPSTNSGRRLPRKIRVLQTISDGTNGRFEGRDVRRFNLASREGEQRFVKFMAWLAMSGGKATVESVEIEI